MHPNSHDVFFLGTEHAAYGQALNVFPRGGLMASHPLLIQHYVTTGLGWALCVWNIRKLHAMYIRKICMIMDGLQVQC